VSASGVVVTDTEVPAIRVRHLWHRYGNFEVLRDVSFEVKKGEIFGFIGPNGAGKTTTIRVLATLLEPTAGRAEINGLDVVVQPQRVRRVVGYMPDHSGIYERITIREYLEFFATAYAVRDLSVVGAVMELADLSSLEDRLVATLSKGMRQRLQVARILLHDPEVLLLDEPASDLDPRARIEIRDLLLELRELGKTILVSSHILTELSDVCTSVGILERGRLVVSGSVPEIAERLASSTERAEPTSPPIEPSGASAPEPVAGSELTTQAGVPIPRSAHKRLKLRVLGEAQAVVPLLSGGSGILNVEPSRGGLLLVEYVGDDRFVADVVRHLVTSGVPVVGIEPERNELERIFLEATRGELQ
jgi:ABC-2 type transport system ATP-binding protein